MRILFSSLATYGHTYPLIPLAVAARRAGHEVAFAVGAEFHPTLSRLDLEPIPAGVSLSEALRIDPEAGELATMEEERLATMKVRMFGSTLPRSFVEDIGKVLRSKPGFDLVVHEAGNPGAGLAAKLAGVPGVCHGFGASGFGGAIRDEIAKLTAELGVPAPDGPVHLFDNPYVDICPPSLQTAEYTALNQRIALRPVPFSDSGELPDMVTEHDRPLVYLTLGTAYGSAAVLRTAIAGLASLDVSVLVTTGAPVEVADLGTLPDNVTAVPWVPQSRVWEHVDLVAHHGGSGTTLNALGAGVPQLLLPQGADQFRNAESVVTAGAGTSLLPEECTAEAVAEAAEDLLFNDRTDAAVSALAKEVAAMPEPSDVAARLPELAGHPPHR